MHSIKCPACGFVGWADAEVCKKCSATLTANSAFDPVHVSGLAVNQQYGRSSNIALKKGLAICSLVLGIVNLFTLGLLGLGAILGITLAVVALGKIKRDPSVYGGKEFATAGLVTSILSIVIIVPIGIIAAIAIPNLLAARRAANEGSAIQALRVISSAESVYASLHGTYGTLEELGAEHLIDSRMAIGERHGYVIKIDISRSKSDSESGFQLIAVPIAYPSTGRRSFYIDETGIIRAANAQGRDATEFDNPLNVDDGDSSRGPTARRNPASDD